jgi:hypothetical protein
VVGIEEALTDSPQAVLQCHDHADVPACCTRASTLEQCLVLCYAPATKISPHSREADSIVLVRLCYLELTQHCIRYVVRGCLCCKH